MEKTTQLSIALENQPGQLARLCRALAQADVNIRGLSINESSDVSTVRLIASDPAAAQEALRGAGLAFVTQEVLVLELQDRPGALEQVALRLADSGINIQYIYGTGDRGAGRGLLVVRTDDVDAARQAMA
jgi:hypothetical protein